MAFWSLHHLMKLQEGTIRCKRKVSFL